MEMPITPPVLVRVPTAVTLPPVIVPAATPSPAVIRMPFAPALLAPVKETFPSALIMMPPALPVFCTIAPNVMLPVAPKPYKLTPAAPMMVAEDDVLIPTPVAAEQPVIEIVPRLELVAETNAVEALP